MNEGLIDCFGHNAWATREVLRACRGLSDEQLQSTVTGTFGSIIDTLRHIIRSEAGYCRRLTGEEPGWLANPPDEPDVAELERRHEETTARWERFLTTPFDSERTFIIPWDDEGERDVPAGIVLAQALHHANEHRTQICTTLTAIGVKAPELGVWEYAAASNRAPLRG